MDKENAVAFAEWLVKWVQLRDLALVVDQTGIRWRSPYGKEYTTADLYDEFNP